MRRYIMRVPGGETDKGSGKTEAQIRGWEGKILLLLVRLLLLILLLLHVAYVCSY